MSAINGTSGADNLVGDSGADTIMGLAGDDTLIGGDGADQLFGGDNNFTSGTGNDSIDGGAGGDFINGGDGDDTIVGGDGDDFVFGGAGADSLSGGPGNDQVSGDLADIFVDGGPGNDQITVSGLSQGDQLHLSQVTAGDGNDTVQFFDFTPTRMVVDGGAGANTLTFAWNGFSHVTTPVEVYLNQAHDGAVVVATGFQSLSFGSNAISAHVFGSDLAETITTAGADDYISGGGGNDVISDATSRFAADALANGGHQESIFGGQGDDSITATDGLHYLRGDDGNDRIFGGQDFDDINGNQGNDTIDGRGGDDWTVGGKGDDNLEGGLGSDIVWGNLGNDTCDGGEGADQVRGGQGDDVVQGGNGDDFVSGDRGNDTVTGGAGADIFHGSQDAGIDLVTDFSQSEGDRVMLDPGTTYTVSQVGADTVIDMGGANQMILKGVTLATLKDGWLFGTDPPPSNPGATGSALATVSQSGMTGFVYDSASGLAYVTASDGAVRAWDPVHGTYKTVAQIGGSPSSIAITPDGRFLLVGDSSSPFATADHTFSAPRTDTITRIDLQSGATETLHFTTQGGATGVAHLVAAPNGQAYLTQDFSGSGGTPFSAFAAEATSPVVTNALGPATTLIGQSSALVLSEHGRYVAIFSLNVSPGGVGVFDTVSGHIIPSATGYPASSIVGLDTGAGDISEAAGQAVNVQTTGIFVWDVGTQLTFAQDLSKFVRHPGDVIGAHFSSNGQLLYLWDTGQHAIVVLDRHTWTPVGAVSVQTNVSFDFFSHHQGEMALSSDGRYLLLDTGAGMEAIDLAARLSIVRTGGAAGETINGDVGRDTLAGGAGDDSIAGYGGDDFISGDAGNDTLIGGAGADIFHGGQGVDRVLDFRVGEGDRVMLDPGATFTVSQSGADTVIDMGGGNQMILIGVQASILPPGSIFLG